MHCSWERLCPVQQGSPTCGPRSSSGPRPVRIWATKQVSCLQQRKASSCLPSTPWLPGLHLPPLLPQHRKSIFHKTGPRFQKGWGPLLYNKWVRWIVGCWSPYSEKKSNSSWEAYEMPLLLLLPPRAPERSLSLGLWSHSWHPRPQDLVKSRLDALLPPLLNIPRTPWPYSTTVKRTNQRLWVQFSTMASQHAMRLIQTQLKPMLLKTTEVKISNGEPWC